MSHPYLIRHPKKESWLHWLIIRILMLLFWFAIISAIIFTTGCASTTLYSHGQRIATFQGDMTAMTFTSAPDGSLTWSSSAVNHSAATLAQGSSASSKITAAAAAAASIACLIP